MQYHFEGDGIMKTKEAIPKTNAIILRDIINKFESIGKIITEGENRGFKRHEILRLIETKVIKL